MAGNGFDFQKAMENEMKRAAAKITLEEMKEQLEAMSYASEGMALMMKSYYDGFVKAGFDSMQAMYLTSNMGTAMISMAMMSPPDSGDKPKGR